MALAVNQTGGNATTASGGAPISFTFGSSTVSGSLIVSITPVFNPGTWAASWWTDSKSNTWSMLDNDGTSLSEHLGIGYQNGGTRGSSHQCTFDPTGGGESSDVGAVEWTGHDTGTPFETAATGKANDTATPFNVTAGAAFPSGAGAMYGCCIGGASGSATVGDPSGYTVVMQQGNADTSLVGYVGYKASETGTPTVGCTWTGTVGSESPREIIIAIRSASGGAAPTDSPYPTEPLVDPQAWMFTYRAENTPFFPDLTPYSADTPTASGDVNVVGWLPAAVHPLATVTGDRTVTGVAYIGAVPYSTSSADRTVAGIVHAGAPQLSTISHAASPVGILYCGPFALTSGGFDYITTGILYATAVPLSTVSHTTSVAGLLPAGVTPYSTVTHAANVTGLVPAGAVPYSTVTHETSIAGILHAAAFALNGPSFDYNVAGILYVGAAQRTTATADRTVAGIVHAGPVQVSTVTASRTVVGIVELGAHAVATVTRSTSVPGLLEVAVYARADLGPTVTLPGITDTIRHRDTGTILQVGTGTMWARQTATIQGGSATGTMRVRTTMTDSIQIL